MIIRHVIEYCGIDGIEDGYIEPGNLIDSCVEESYTWCEKCCLKVGNSHIKEIENGERRDSPEEV